MPSFRVIFFFSLSIWNKNIQQDTKYMYLRLITVYHEKELEYTVFKSRKTLLKNSKPIVSFENVE